MLKMSFVSSSPEDREFLVFRSQRVISSLSPAGADLRFGLQFQGLPRANLASLIGGDGDLTDRVVTLIPHGHDLVAALKAFDMLLAGDSDPLISNLVEAAVGGFIDSAILSQVGDNLAIRSASESLLAATAAS